MPSNVGDEIVMYYDGSAMETDPLQVSTIYAITLKTPAQQIENIENTTYNWGITLTAENVTPTSSTIKCLQSGGEPTGELQTGSYFVIENWTEKDGWTQAPYYCEAAWTEEALMIPKDNVTEWEIDWEWLYSSLSAGKYRLGKEIMDFRGPGDYDTQMIYAEFEIK